MRAILPNAPWVSADEKAAAEKTIEFLRSSLRDRKSLTQLGPRGARGRTGGNLRRVRGLSERPL
jgi:Ca-activated chloride channel family protein